MRILVKSAILLIRFVGTSRTTTKTERISYSRCNYTFKCHSKLFECNKVKRPFVILL